MHPQSTASLPDLAWAAGFIDGEGCIRVYRTNRPRRTYGSRATYQVALEATNRDIHPLIDLRQMFGGYIFADKARPPRAAKKYRWRCVDSMTQTALEAMSPYFRIKGPQARLAMAFRKIQRVRLKRRQPLSITEIAIRDWFVTESKKLNAKGCQYSDGSQLSLGALRDAAILYKVA